MCSNNKQTLICFIGASGSGKTTLLEQLNNESDISIAVSHTTRDMREGEVNGKDYHFITKSEFDSFNAYGIFVEVVLFNGNNYAIAESEIIQSNTVGIVVEPNGVLHLQDWAKDNNVIFKTVHLSIPNEIRMQRMMNPKKGEPIRSKADIIKRLDSDDIDERWDSTVKANLVTEDLSLNEDTQNDIEMIIETLGLNIKTTVEG